LIIVYSKILIDRHHLTASILYYG